MHSLRRGTLSAAALILVGGVGTVVAQQSYPSVKMVGRLQEQFYYLSNSDDDVYPTSNFLLRRARITAKAQIAENISVVIQPSFEGGRTITNGGTRGGVRLRDAFIDVRLTPADAATQFTLRGGQEKRPFGRYELTSSNNLPSIERGAGPGHIGSASNDMFSSAGFMGHDIGAALRVEHKLDDARAVNVVAGVYNGAGETVNDVNNKKSFGVRATVGVTPMLDVGGAVFSHDAIVGTDSSFTHTAWGVDAAWSKPGAEGVYLVGDYIQGEARTAAKEKMMGVSFVGAYNMRMTNPSSWLYAIEPAVRFDFADPDTDVDDNGVTTISGVLGFYLTSRAQFRVAYESQSFQGGTATVSGVRTALTVNF